MGLFQFGASMSEYWKDVLIGGCLAIKDLFWGSFCLS
jgi:hypothetical protein